MQPHDIGDHNLERLLSAAYQPEPVDAAFAQRLEQRLAAEAQTLAARHVSPPDETHLHRFRRRMGWTMGLAASVAVVALVWYGQTRPDHVRPEDPYARLQTTLASWRDDFAHGLRPRALPPAPAVQPLAVGASLTTAAGERRRVGLADGSILYVNASTQVVYTATRHLELARGEIYVEVAPRPTGEVGATFVVQTPAREVTALGTRFGVQAGEDGAGVVVTQGTVKVDGVVESLCAGQQLVPGSAKPQAAARVSQTLDWTRELMAAAESPLVPACKHAGGALLAIDPNGQEVNLTLRISHIDVHIEDGFARTTIDHTYFNNLYGRTEGTFYFPLPPDASLSRLAMYVEDKDGLCRLMEGGMAERDHARNVYETILHQRRDPALLEWVDGSTFKMRVFPLEGRKEKRILLSYTQRLASHDGTTRYRFPAGHSLDLVRDSSFSVRVKEAGVRGQGSGVRNQELQVKCLSHPNAKFTKELKDTVVAWAGRGVKQDKDIALEIVDPAGKGMGEDQARFAAFEHEKQNYLMVRFRPHLEGKPKAERRDWIVLFEASANRDPLVARAQVEIVRKLFENAGHDDTVAVVIAGARTRVLDKGLRTLNEKNRQAAIEFLESAHLVGALDLGAALDALAPFWKDAKNPHILHVGAGIPAMGPTQLDALVSKIPQDIRYVGVGVGKRWNRAFMKQAAERTGGLFTQINPDESIAWRAFDLLATLNTPRLLSVRVLDHSEKAVFLTDAALVAQGEELCAITRYHGDRPDKVIIAGRLDGKQYTRVFAVDKVHDKAGYLPRTWAKLEIDRLSADGADKNKDAITTLSKASYVMSPFTSLLVLETDADYTQYKIDRGRKDHWAMYPAPDRIPIVYEHSDPPAVKVDQPAAQAREKAEQILDTIIVRVPPTLIARPGEQARQPSPSMPAKYFYQGIAAMQISELQAAEEFGIEVGMQTSWGHVEDFLKSMDLIKAVERHHRNPELPALLGVLRRDLFQGSRVQGKVLKRSLRAGDIIRPEDLLGDKEFTLANLMPEGFRRIGVRVNNESIAGGFANLRHSRVDIVSTVQRNGTSTTQVLLENVLVLATDSQIHRNENGQAIPANVVTFALKPEDALKVDLARSMGPLSVVLRRINDNNAEAIEDLSRTFSGAPRDRIDFRKTGWLDVFGRPARGQMATEWTDAQFRVYKDLMRSARLEDSLVTEDLGRIARTYYPRIGLGTGTMVPYARPLHATYYELTNENGRIKYAPVFVSPSMQWAVPNAVSKDTELGFVDPIIGINERLRERSSVEFFPPALAITVNPYFRGRVHTSISGGIIGGKVKRAEAARLEALERGLSFGYYDFDAATYGLRGAKPYIYERPQFVPDPRFFGDLTLFAPGLQTSQEDIYAVLEQETKGDAPKLGTIDDAARALIDKSRSAGWQSIEIPAHNREPAYKVRFNGAGHFAYERILSIGLREQVVCDGATLLHLYPEIGLAGRRTYSRHHQQIAELAPWLVPGAEELARGFDVKAIDASTVALVRPGMKATDTDLQTHLVFARDGRLAERRLVLTPKNDVLVRVVYDGQGNVKFMDGKGKVWAEQKIETAQASVPDLQPNLKDFVVVPLPLRTQAKTVPQGKIDRYEDLSEQQMIGLLAEAVANGNGRYALQLYGYRFTKDPRPGFLTLLSASGMQLKFNEQMDVNGVKATFDLSEPRFQTPLGKYLVNHHRTLGVKDPPFIENMPGDGFVQEFSRFRNLYTLHTTRKVRTDNGYDIIAEYKKVNDFLRSTRSPLLAFALEDALFKDGQLVNREQYAMLAEAFPDAGLFTSVFRYENGRSWVGMDKNEVARKAYTEYYEDGLKAGVVMPVEDRFVEAFGKDGGFAAFMRKQHAAALKDGEMGLALALAEQCQQLQQTPLADELYLAAYRAADKDERLFVGLAVVNHLENTKQLAPAETLMKELLADANVAKLPGMWRRASNLAQQRNLVARAAACLDTALDLEFRNLPEVVNLEPLRSDYRTLLQHYQQLAGALTMLETETPKDFVAKVIRAADRWRSLDTDNVEPCNLAAKILQTVGARELAWDYLTTPIGAKPNESGPWLNLAKALRDDADYALADLAYAQAFQAEATNPQILWDRAMNLTALGRGDEARRLYRQIADGPWQDRFSNLKSQAQTALQR